MTYQIEKFSRDWKNPLNESFNWGDYIRNSSKNFEFDTIEFVEKILTRDSFEYEPDFFNIIKPSPTVVCENFWDIGPIDTTAIKSKKYIPPKKSAGVIYTEPRINLRKITPMIRDEKIKRLSLESKEKMVRNSIFFSSVRLQVLEETMKKRMVCNSKSKPLFIEYSYVKRK